MSKPETITIDDVQYIRADIRPPVAGDVRIVILQRGWVMVGRLERDGSRCILHNASVVRVWGTTKGLPEIANDGPTAKTVLDSCDGDVEFHELTMIAALACREDKWLSRL